MPHLLELHFRRFIKYYEINKKNKNIEKEKKKENIKLKKDINNLNFEDFFYENLTIFF
tara:strand:+ start:3496 stop:3669 length:174 start_codon:yes stop_codon:yes gene_type:complete